MVPGDLIELPKHQATLVCDAILLTGQCILNESMLTGKYFSNFSNTYRLYKLVFTLTNALFFYISPHTLLGESVPVTKTSLPLRHTLYDAKEHTYHTLYSGTTIIQTKYETRYFYSL